MPNPYGNFLANRVTRPGQDEVMRQSLYDFLIYPFGGAAQLQFFQQPKGQGQASYNGAAAGVAKTLQDTNMDLAGMIPAGKIFKAESIEVPFFPGAVATPNVWTPALGIAFAIAAAQTVQKAIDDVRAFYTSGSLTFFILSKSYLDEAPLLRFPPKTRMEVRAALSTNSATVGELAQAEAWAAGRPYMLKPEIALTSVQNFSINLTWGAAVAMPSGFNGRVGVILDGLLQRASQ